MNLSEIIKSEYNKSISECTNEEIYNALLTLVKTMAEGKQHKNSKKKLYYISAEFLIGKLLSNNLINLGIYDDIKEELAKNGKDLCEIEEFEKEPSLGNGGLGRLAACFLDSIATLGLNGDGVGLNYHFGLFRQVFKNNAQTTIPDPWLTEKSWLTKTDVTYTVKFRDMDVTSRMYDIDVTGYDSTTNKLHLFDIESVDENIVEDGINFNKEDIEKNLTLFLYPDDSDDAGRILRIYQQYFMVSSAAQLILDEAVEKGCKLYDLADYAVIQINDTHPTMVIPELIRLMVERGLETDDAIEAVTRACAYTNHTILAEALEKWPISYLKKVVPQLIPIIEVLDDKVRRKYDDGSVYIIDREERVHMAHIDIHYSLSVNGVASLHTDILKNVELNNFYKIYPEKFNNKTNGITFRRWLIHSNPQLTELITSLIGDGFKKDATELEKLLDYKDNEEVLNKILSIKNTKKAELKNALMERQNVEINENSIFDIQIKRLHEYKRQQLNALYIIHKYLEIKAGKKPTTPITVIFGAKAAPAYIIAQDIIHLILCLQELINNDPEVSPYLKVVMVENYNVTWAEKLIPACDISEQISLASKEASGTGNMKFMLNGAPTLGTMDGANVEIVQEVGEENAFIFGLSSQEVINYENNGGYNPVDIYFNDWEIKRVVDQLMDGTYSNGDHNMYINLYSSLLNTQCTDRADTYFILKDFRSYADAQKRVEEAYRDQQKWSKMAMLNTACSGKFTSDRTIEEYVRDIWHLEKVEVPSGQDLFD